MSRWSVSRRVLALLVLCWLIGTLRAFALWAHAPLYAYANSYDQVRYTNCFHFYPDRSLAIPPEENSPNAPFADYRFIAHANPMCYWSSELLFGGMTALIWKAGEALNTGELHSVRWLGALRWLALLAISIGLSRAWLQRNDVRAALANAALLPLVFADPGNTLYLNTFYAEWTALLGAYALVALCLLWRDDAASVRRFLLLALTAFALALAKIQHLLLPLCLAFVVFALERSRHGRSGWRAAALALGAVAGLAVQGIQLARDNGMMDSIHEYNRADVVFTGLLPFAEDRAALLQELEIDPACAAYSGMHAWELPDLPERVCGGLEHFTRSRELLALARHPILALRLAGHGVIALDPWIARNLGQVQGATVATIPASMPGIGPMLHVYPLQWTLLGLPLVALLVLSFRPGWRRGSQALDYTAVSVALMLTTLAITVLGDGLADTAKQGHLVVNAALAWAVASLVAFLHARVVATRPPSAAMLSIDRE